MRLTIKPQGHWVIGFLCVAFISFKPALAGLGPHQVILIYDEENEESIAIADHYAALRDIPRDYFCPVTVKDMIDRKITWTHFSSDWRPLLEACVNTRDYKATWVFALSSHLPHRVTLPSSADSMSMVAALQTFFLKHDGVPFVPNTHQSSNGVLQPSWENPAFVGTENPNSDFEFRETGDSTYNGVSSLVRSLLLPQEALLTVETASLAGNLSLAYHLEGLRHIDGLSLIENAVRGEDRTALLGAFAGMRGVSDARRVRDPETHFLTKVLNDKGRSASYLMTHDGSLCPITWWVSLLVLSLSTTRFRI